MNYFFTSLLQTLLPFALLLGYAWSYHPQVNMKSRLWLVLLCFVAGAILSIYLPKSQRINLVLSAWIITSLLLFCLSQYWHNKTLTSFWHVLLSFIAGLLWGKDPNLSAITHTDVINTDFILHSSAIILAILLAIFVASWLNLLLQQNRIQQKLTALPHLLTFFIVLILLLPQSAELLLSLMKLQLLDLTKARLSFVAKAGNLTNFFNYLQSAILLIIMLSFWFRVHLARKHAVQQETHPIEKRKKRATLLTSSRLLQWGLICTLIIFTTQLYWDKVASQPPRLSEAMPVHVDDKNQIYIPIEQVKDGKLHRFVWIADDGKAVRFFLINRQPDRLSLAAVFDACILCGDQGYVMEGDQVICVGCGVRMFIPSIGKPGGCNPVPIENWQQTDTQVIIHKKSLEDGLHYFSTVVEIDVIDPVDHSQLKNTHTEHKYSYEGKTYFFATEKNLHLFRDAPENYLNAEGGK
ncbi:Fe-S-containing protein [Pasteurella multocida]|uniref:Fe-S-containing protein n=1 Tax=Pasteurella multocida TaxID=747 RepID=UPI002B45E8AD|nr:Fe-S-containing protein [Pasteurella multocida]WRK09777.1 Fe-S-containing protein [Pasteurella multocida]